MHLKMAMDIIEIVTGDSRHMLEDHLPILIPSPVPHDHPEFHQMKVRSTSLNQTVYFVGQLVTKKSNKVVPGQQSQLAGSNLKAGTLY